MKRKTYTEKRGSIRTIQYVSIEDDKKAIERLRAKQVAQWLSDLKQFTGREKLP